MHSLPLALVLRFLYLRIQPPSTYSLYSKAKAIGYNFTWLHLIADKTNLLRYDERMGYINTRPQFASERPYYNKISQGYKDRPVSLLIICSSCI